MLMFDKKKMHFQSIIKIYFEYCHMAENNVIIQPYQTPGPTKKIHCFPNFSFGKWSRAYRRWVEEGVHQKSRPLLIVWSSSWQRAADSASETDLTGFNRAPSTPQITEEVKRGERLLFESAVSLQLRFPSRFTRWPESCACTLTMAKIRPLD